MSADEFEPMRTAWRSLAEPAPDARDRVRGRLLATIHEGRGRRHRRRVLLLVATVLLGLLAAVPGLSRTRYGWTVEWLAGAPPADVTADLAAIDQGAPSGMEQRPVVTRTRLVYDRMTRLGRARIWLTPTTRPGRYCEVVVLPAGGGRVGGCFTGPPRAPVEVSVVRVAGVDLAPSFITGRVAPDVARLRLDYVNGQTEDVPVQGGFFVAAVDADRSGRLTDHPAALVGLDRHGGVLGRTPVEVAVARAPALPLKPAVATGAREQVAMRVKIGTGSEALLYRSPSRLGGSCDRLAVDGTTWSWGCADPDRLPRPIQIAVVRPPVDRRRDAATLILGVVRSGLDVGLRYEDGDVEPLPLAGRSFLLALPERRRRAGHRLAEIVVTRAGTAVLRLPIATRDERLYDGTPDPAPRVPAVQISNPVDLPVVARLRIQGARGERIELAVRRETPTHWFVVVSVDGRAVSGEDLRWFPGGRVRPVAFEGLPLDPPQSAVTRSISLFVGTLRPPAATARIVYADGRVRRLGLAVPAAPVGGGIRGWFVYELSERERGRAPRRFEGLDSGGRVVGRADLPPGV